MNASALSLMSSGANTGLLATAGGEFTTWLRGLPSNTVASEAVPEEAGGGELLLGTFSSLLIFRSCSLIGAEKELAVRMAYNSALSWL